MSKYSSVEKASLFCLGLALGGCAGSTVDSVADTRSADVLPESENDIPTPSEIVEVPPLPTEPDKNDPNAPWQVARLKIGDTEVHFIHVTTLGESAGAGSTPIVNSVIMRTKGVIGRPNAVDELRARADVPLTFAEIYVGLVGGRDGLPDVLAAYHVRQAKALGRTVELLDPGLLDGLTSAGGSRLLATFTHPFAPFTPEIPGHHWVEVKLSDAWFCPLDGPGQPGNPPTNCPTTGTVRTKYGCAPRASVSSIFWGVPTASSCTQKTPGWLRHGVQNRTTAAGGGGGMGTTNYPFTAQEYYGPIVGQDWGSFPAFIVNRLEYYVDDWDVPEQKKMAIVVSRTQQGFGVSSLMTGRVVSN